MNTPIKLSLKNVRCASCIKTIESTLKNINGVSNAIVNFADKTILIDGDVPTDVLINAIHKAGYDATPYTNDHQPSDTLETIKQLKWHLKKSFTALGLGIPLFCIGFFQLLPPLTTFTGQLSWFILGMVSLIVMLYAGGYLYKNAWHAFIYHQATMDTLISIGTGTAWIYSQYITLFPHTVPSIAQHVYFEAGLVIIGLVNLGAALEIRARGKTSQAIKHLISLQPKTARVIRDDRDYDVPIEDVQVDDLIRIRPGEKIPVDGLIIEGSTLVDESMISGEPVPVKKSSGNTVTGSTLNKTGALIIKATHVGKDATLSHIIQLIQQAQNTKPPITRLADKVSSIFVPTVMIFSIITALIWFNTGTHDMGYILVAAISVLIIACPCALGLAAPISVMVGMGKAAEHGVLIRNGDALQQASKLTTIVLDKTGTITQGRPEITDIFPYENTDKKQLLQLAASLEKNSEHPLGQSIIDTADIEKITLLPTKDFTALPGLGVKAIIDGQTICIGNAKLMHHENIHADHLLEQINKLAILGKTPVFIARNQCIIGIIAIADPVKTDTKQAIERLKKSSIKIVMLTGDNKATAKAVAHQVGIDHVIANVLPHEKSNAIQALQDKGDIVGMVGDGINDAPALAHANVGFAIGSGTDVAIESADITLMRSSIHGVVDAIAISNATMRNIKQNLLGAFLYNSLGIPIAAGILFPLTDMLLNPMIAGAAMALSSLTVVSNANRLRWFTPKGESA